MLTLVTLATVLAGCGGSSASVPPTATVSAAMSPTAAPALPAASSQAPAAGRTFPPSQTPIEPGTYQWTGFDPTISIEVRPGWQLGHDNAAFFGLFRGSDFPSVSYARFTDVYVDETTRTAARDAAAVVTTFSGRSDLTVTAASPIHLGGLAGRQFDVVTTKPQTPLYFGPAGDFRLDPQFKTRYRVLDWPTGGILVIGIHARDANFDDGLALGEPVVASLTVQR